MRAPKHGCFPLSFCTHQSNKQSALLCDFCHNSQPLWAGNTFGQILHLYCIFYYVLVDRCEVEVYVRTAQDMFFYELVSLPPAADLELVVANAVQMQYLPKSAACPKLLRNMAKIAYLRS